MYNTLDIHFLIEYETITFINWCVLSCRNVRTYTHTLTVRVCVCVYVGAPCV